MEKEYLHFIPSRFEGLPDVTEVMIYPTYLKVFSDKQWHTVNFSEISQSSKPRWLRQLLTYLGFKSSPLMIGEKDWFHHPVERFIRFYTEPQITVFMPVDEPEEYFESYYWRAQILMVKGGFQLFDLG